MQNGNEADHVLPQDTKPQFDNELAVLGVTQELCEFYGEALKYERDMTYATYRMSKELRDEVAKKVPDICAILTMLQTMTKKFNVWRQVLEDLAQRQSSLPVFKLDLCKLNQFHSTAAKCSFQNDQIKFKEGETIILTDLSHPTRVKVRNEYGQEGYMPKASCVMPSPDKTAASAIDRLQIHLLTYWFDCDNKIESSLREVITSLLPTIKNILNDNTSSSTNHHDNGLKKWHHHVTRINESVTDHSDQSWNTLHTVLNDLESDLDQQSNSNLNSLTEVVSNLDRVVTCYKGFHDDRCQFQAKLEQSSSRPIICHASTKDVKRSGRHCRYYEIRLTALDTVVTEETVHITKTNKQNNNKQTVSSENGSVQDGGTYETAETEELTSVCHEENVKYVVRAVIDPRDGREITIEEAVRYGIVNHQLGVFVNPRTGQRWPIPVAMNDGRILVERVVTSRSADQKRSIGLITISVQTDTREYVITGAVDMATGVTLSAEEARERGIIDEAGGFFLNTKTQERISLSDAVDAGHVNADFDNTDSGPAAAHCETKSFAICGVVDQVEKKAVPFNVAIRRGLIDRQTGCYINNVTGERVLASEAVKRGFFKCSPVDEATSLTDIDNSNRVVADRIQHIRKNVLRNMSALSAFKKSTQP